MKRINQIIAIVIALYTLPIAALAEETHMEQLNQDIDNSNTAIIENYTASDKNGSSPNVNIFKHAGSNESLIYSGELDKFSGGILKDAKLSDNQYTLIFNWNNENEYYYITPSAEAESSSIQSVGNTSVSSDTSGNITTGISIVYDGKYYENVLIPGQTITVPITVKNTDTAAHELIPYIAQYDLNGKLLKFKKGTGITAAANSSASGTISEELTADGICTAKIFLWEKDSLKPLHDPVILKATPGDYYAGEFANAEAISLDKYLCGIINTSGDVDIIKMRPPKTGLYAMCLDSNSDAVAELYDSNQNLIKATSSNDKYLFYNLSGYKDYYIRFSGSANSNYVLSPAKNMALKVTLENSGWNTSVGTDNICSLFSFVPSEDGAYIITANGTAGVKASMYNENYEYISSAQEADDDVSFRITNNLQAGKRYYILVTSKTYGAAENYTLYIEQPFDIVSAN